MEEYCLNDISDSVLPLSAPQYDMDSGSQENTASPVELTQEDRNNAEPWEELNNEEDVMNVEGHYATEVEPNTRSPMIGPQAESEVKMDENVFSGEKEIPSALEDVTVFSDATTEGAKPSVPAEPDEQLNASSEDMLLIQQRKEYYCATKWFELEPITEETCKSPSVPGYLHVEKESTIATLSTALKHEQRKHKTTAARLDKICRRLQMKEEQYCTEVKERQRAEEALESMELEVMQLICRTKQMEEDRDAAQNLQRQLEEENRRCLAQIDETVLQLREASDRERELLEGNLVLQDLAAALKLELEQERSEKKREEDRQSEASEALTERLEDVMRDLKVSEETLAQTISQYNGQLVALRAKMANMSKMADRLSELERENQELRSQAEVERSKSETMERMREIAELKLETEIQRNGELQAEVCNQRALVKNGTKKLTELEGMERRRQLEIEATLGAMKASMDELSKQREEEALKRSKLEAENRDLEKQLSSLKALKKHYKQAKKCKKQLEAEVESLKGRLETSRLEQEQAQKEVRKKIEEVNLFLYIQAASQDSQEHIRVANEASIKRQLEQRIQDLEGDLAQARRSEQDSLCQKDCARTETQHYRDLYNEEARLRKALAAKLDRLSDRLEEANSRHQRSLYRLTSSIANSSSIDISSFQVT